MPVLVMCFQRLTLTKEPSGKHEESDAQKMRNRIIKRAALEFKEDMYGILEYEIQY